MYMTFCLASLVRLPLGATRVKRPKARIDELWEDVGSLRKS